MPSAIFWKVGRVQVYPIVELDAGKIIQDVVEPATPEAVLRSPWLVPLFADDQGLLKAVVQAFLVLSDGKYILIDACNGNDKDRTDVPEWGHLKTGFLNSLESICPAEEVSKVVCTHIHMDHVGWNTRLGQSGWVATFPRAEYLFVRDEYEYWESKPEQEIADDKAAFDDSVVPVVAGGLATLVPSDHAIDANLRLTPSPGHTPYHCSVVIESEGESALLSGDFLHHPCQIANPAWSTVADFDQELARRTRSRMLTELADTRRLLIGSHFPSPSAGHVVVLPSGDYAFRPIDGQT